MKHFLYHIIGEGILISLLVFSTICLYNQAQIINKQRELIDELQFEYINIGSNIDSIFYKGFHNNALLDSISYMYNE